MIIRSLLIFVTFLSLLSCSKNQEIYEPTKKSNPYVLYKEGLDAFDRNDFFFANKKFSEAELNFSVVESAAKASIMSGFSLYMMNFYSEALENLERFKKTYASDENIIYAHYLEAVIYYEQITDEKDLEPLKNQIKILF